MEFNFDIAALVTGLVSLLALVGSAYSWWVNRDLRKATSKLRRAEADGKEIENLASLSERLSTLEDERAKDYEEMRQLRDEHADTLTELRKMRADQAVLQLTLSRYERGVKILIAQLRRMDIEPEWTPEDDELL